MNMKKIIICILSLFLVINFLGCENKKTEINENDRASYSTNVWERGISKICKSNSGYYAFSGDFIYTVENQKMYPLCNKADCEHNTIDCNAYLKKAQQQTIWYDGEGIYVIGMGKNGTYSLYKISTDGSGSEKLSDIFQTTGMKSFSIASYFNGNYMYYKLTLRDAADIAAGSYSDKLYRIELKSKAQPELVYENKDGESKNSTAIGKCYFYDGYIYMTIIKFNDENTSYGLYRYSIENNTMELFLSRYMSYYFITDDILYYTDDAGIHKYSLDGTIDELFYENPKFCGAMIYDGTNIYLDDSWYQSKQETHSDMFNIYILNMDGVLLKECSVNWEREPLYGDGEDIIMQGEDIVNENDSSWRVRQFYFYDKSQIGAEQDEWICIEQREISDLE